MKVLHECLFRIIKMFHWNGINDKAEMLKIISEELYKIKLTGE